MDITSIQFGFFFLISIILYWLIPQRGKWIILLISSLTFYVLSARFFTIIYMLIAILVVYFSAIYFERTKDDPSVKSKRRFVLLVAIACNAGFLIVLKYMNFIISNLNFFLNDSMKFAKVQWYVPLGISYYTLQLLAYLLDSYWGVTEVERNPAKLTLYTCYFPQMISGPISRHNDLGKQLNEGHKFNYDSVTTGLIRVAWGLVKKMAVSNRLGVIVDHIWNDPTKFDGIWVWIGAFGFCVQLYADFSGCMDIICGVSMCFGIRLSENFNAPFFSKNIQEFWNRWHITLGTWLRDYIMNPILKSDTVYSIGEKAKMRFGKKRGRKVPSYIAMFVLWTLMGVWHGDSWKYIIGEGWWFWIVLVLAGIFEPELNRTKAFLHINDESDLWKAFQTIRTWWIFSTGMIFFRSESLIRGMQRIASGFKFSGHAFIDRINDINYNTNDPEGNALMIISLILMIFCEHITYKGISPVEWLKKRNAVFRYMIYYLMIFIILFSANSGQQEFIYAQF